MNLIFMGFNNILVSVFTTRVYLIVSMIFCSNTFSVMSDSGNILLNNFCRLSNASNKGFLARGLLSLVRLLVKLSILCMVALRGKLTSVIFKLSVFGEVLFKNIWSLRDFIVTI